MLSIVFWIQLIQRLFRAIYNPGFQRLIQVTNNPYMQSCYGQVTQKMNQFTQNPNDPNAQFNQSDINALRGMAMGARQWANAIESFANQVEAAHNTMGNPYGQKPFRNLNQMQQMVNNSASIMEQGVQDIQKQMTENEVDPNAFTKNPINPAHAENTPSERKDELADAFQERVENPFAEEAILREREAVAEELFADAPENPFDDIDAAVNRMTDNELEAEVGNEFARLVGNEDLVDLSQEPEIIRSEKAVEPRTIDLQELNQEEDDVVLTDEEANEIRSNLEEELGKAVEGNKEDLIDADEADYVLMNDAAKQFTSMESKQINLQDLNKDVQKVAIDALSEDISNQIVKEEWKLNKNLYGKDNISADELTRDEKAIEMKYKLLKDNRYLSDEFKNELKAPYEQMKELEKESKKFIQKANKSKEAFKEKYKEELAKRNNKGKNTEKKNVASKREEAEQTKPAQQKSPTKESGMPQSSFEKRAKNLREMLKHDSMDTWFLFSQKEAHNMSKAAKAYEEALSKPKLKNKLEERAREFQSACDKYLKSMEAKQKENLKDNDNYRIAFAKFGKEESKELLDGLETARECVAYNNAHKTNLTPEQFKKQKVKDEQEFRKKQLQNVRDMQKKIMEKRIEYLKEKKEKHKNIRRNFTDKTKQAMENHL